jgi:hypothetical protein
VGKESDLEVCVRVWSGAAGEMSGTPGEEKTYHRGSRKRLPMTTPPPCSPLSVPTRVSERPVRVVVGRMSERRG